MRNEIPAETLFLGDSYKASAQQNDAVKPASEAQVPHRFHNITVRL
jgi:hypothetical protein